MKFIIRFACEGMEDQIETTIDHKQGLDELARSLIAAHLGLDKNECEFIRLAVNESLGYQNTKNDEVFLNYLVKKVGKEEEETESVNLYASESQESRITHGGLSDGTPLSRVGSEPGTVEFTANAPDLNRPQSTPPTLNPRGLNRSQSTPSSLFTNKERLDPQPRQDDDEHGSKPQIK